MDRAGRRPLNSRSLIASTLLGTYPPELPGGLLVAFGELFDIAPGTTRVALSRMVQRGELANADGRYRLVGALAERQQQQDQGRRESGTKWAGQWEQWIVPGGKRSADERAQLRDAATTLRLAELRDGVWMRPANLPADRWPDHQTVLASQAEKLQTRPATTEAARTLAWSMWDLDGWATEANELIAAMRATKTEDQAAIPHTFNLAADVVRHLFHDPVLPPELLGDGWPGDALRLAYDRHEADLQSLLREFFRSASE